MHWIACEPTGSTATYVFPALIELLCMHCAMQAAGAAYALKRRAVQNVAVCYFGDGAASEGV
jgi:TPP-dependent pyruvate/acetoin dehydrogenase alpha subunit